MPMAPRPNRGTRNREQSRNVPIPPRRPSLGPPSCARQGVAMVAPLGRGQFGGPRGEIACAGQTANAPQGLQPWVSRRRGGSGRHRPPAKLKRRFGCQKARSHSSVVAPMPKPIALATLLLTLLVAPAPAGNLDLPDLGDPSGGALSPQEEALLGKAFMRRLRATSRVMEDPLWNGYLQELGSGLTAHSDQAAGAFTFFLVRDPEVNAFAGPAGHIGIHTGLVLATESEAELASVLAHEIAHVTQNHLRRAFDDAGRLSLPAAAAILAGIVLGAMADNPQVGAAAVAGVQAGLIQHQINFTRDNEQEADRIGIQILADSAYDPTAMPVFFGRLGKSNRLYDSGRIPEFLRTHPITENRIADSHARAEGYPYRQTPDSLEYHLLRATLELGRQQNSAAAVATFRDTLREGRYRNEEAQRYGYVLALLQARRFDQAEQELDRLLRGNPLQVAYLLAQARLLRETGRKVLRPWASWATPSPCCPGTIPSPWPTASCSSNRGGPPRPRPCWNASSAIPQRRRPSLRPAWPCGGGRGKHSIQDVGDQPVRQLGLEPGGLGRHHLAGVGHRHQVACMVVGNREKATAISPLSTRRSSSPRPRMPPTKSMRSSRR
jgi:beta-barrel assembly-enhancing protease